MYAGFAGAKTSHAKYLGPHRQSTLCLLGQGRHLYQTNHNVLKMDSGFRRNDEMRQILLIFA